jgi:hypothetical protein
MVHVVVRRRIAEVLCAALLATPTACRREASTSSAPSPEAVARTEFTERIENFFEHEPLVAGRPSAFLIHLTDLSDGSPVDKAEVILTVRGEPGGPGVETAAKAGRVTGIYVAHVTVPTAGRYTVEFRVKNAKLDERMVLDDFTTGGKP